MGNEEQGWRDKDYQFKGSKRAFYVGSEIGSTTGYNWIGFSGTNTGFGAAGNEVCNRIILAGSNNSVLDWSWDGTNLHGEIYGTNNAIAMDGVMRSGIYVRAADNSNDQIIKIWAW